MGSRERRSGKENKRNAKYLLTDMHISSSSLGNYGYQSHVGTV